MYEQRFGLTYNPFRTAAEGANVFVGPQQADLISGLQRALEGRDNVVCVSGLAGAGKTTIVSRALETNNRVQVVASIGRMRLTPDELLPLLLGGFGASRLPTGTVQRFALFKKLLNEQAAADKRVIIVIEDALRIGNDALLELETLTASDGGASCGANIILMGPPEIDKRMTFPEFARLQQRARKPQRLHPFNITEVHGYLRHCMRVAGANYNKIFETGVAMMLFRCSEGIPRVINNICDAVFMAAAENSFDRITPQLVQNTAEDQFGIEPAPADPTSKVEDERLMATMDDLDDIDPRPEISVASNAQPEPEVAPAGETGQPQSAEESGSFPLPPVVAAALAQEKEEDVAELPDLDQRTTNHENSDSDVETDLDIPAEFQPDPEMEIAASTLASPNSQTDIVEADPAAFEKSTTFDNLPMLSNSMRVEMPTIAGRLVTDKEADGKDAESSADRPVPDLDALEAAISAARTGTPTTKKRDREFPESSSEDDDSGDTSVELPRLNLNYAESEHEPIAAPNPVVELDPVLDTDPALQLEPLPEPTSEAHAGEASAPDITLDTALDESLEIQRSDSKKLDEMAAELAKANSLEDISDVMAETLFGTEFEQIAADALINPQAAGTAPGETDVIVAPVVTATAPSPAPANEPVAEALPAIPDPKPVTVELPPSPKPSPPETSSAAGKDVVPAPAVPESIEDQFQTSITQTLKALDVARMAEEKIDPEDQEDEKPSGLLGRLRKSLKS